MLDALDIDVPVPLWDAASRTAQPSGGYLPDTGVLADLAQSAQRGDAGRTILLVMRTLGADGPEAANILALGDAIRALKRVAPGGGCAAHGPGSPAAGVAAARRQLR